MEVLEFELLFN